jgi:hypothetical protein
VTGERGGGERGARGYLPEFVKFLNNAQTDRHLLSCFCAGAGRRGKGGGGGGAFGRGGGGPCPWRAAPSPGFEHLAHPFFLFFVPTSSFVRCIRTSLSVHFAAENATVRERQVHE